jgi:hypothetical protein
MQDKETLFKKILPKVGWLAMNVFGNYVIQASFTSCSEALLISVKFEVPYLLIPMFLPVNMSYS